MRDTTFTVDIEPTNRCNATCHFCPRDQTPHQGLMTPETFEQALQRTLEYDAEMRVVLGDEGGPGPHAKVSLCGLGEPLLNSHTPDFIRQTRAAGLTCYMSSNGALLDDARSEAVLEAGLERIMINIGEVGDDYEDVYGLPFERTRDRITEFASRAEGRCEVWVVLVDHRQDEEHLAAMRSFWRDRGIRLTMEFEVMNRGGALFVDHMQYEQDGELDRAQQLLGSASSDAYCVTPFVGAFIGYDGVYYLCCSDWKKEVGFGTVFERSITDVMREKFVAVNSREPICKLCNHDPTNRMIDTLKGVDQGALPAGAESELVESMSRLSDRFTTGLERIRPGVTAPVPVAAPRRLIPVTAVEATS